MVQNNPNTNTVVITQTTGTVQAYPGQVVQTYPGQVVQTYPGQPAQNYPGQTNATEPPPVYSQQAVPPGQYPMADHDDGIPPKVA